MDEIMNKTAEQPFDLVPQLVDVLVENPWILPVYLRRHNRRHFEIANELRVLSLS